MRAASALETLAQRPPRTPEPDQAPWSGAPARYRLSAVDEHVRNNPSFRWRISHCDLGGGGGGGGCAAL